MNREMRRLQAREERLQKKNEQDKRTPGRQAASKEKSDLPLHKRLVRFLKEVRTELQRVSWPTRQQMVAFTAVTLITTVALTLLVFVIDLGFREGVFAVLRWLT